MISVFGSKVGEEEMRQISDSINNSWLGMGPKVSEFEDSFKDRLGLPHFLMVDSGSNALYMAVAVLNLKPGSEVILPSFTWVSCAQAIILAGLIPVFCDVELTTQNVNADLIKEKITEKTAAIMIVHYAGKPVDMDPILALGYPVIEDAAHAVDSQYKGQFCGGISDVGIYSFDAVKNLTAIEGGGIAFRDQAMYDRAKRMRYCGIGKSGFTQSQNDAKEKSIWWEYDISEVFIKMLPTDIAAGVGLAQLTKIDALQEYRREIWQMYQDAFQNVEWIETPSDPEPHEKHSYFTYLIRVPNRDALARYLLDQGVYTTVRYHPLHLNAIYGSDAALPVSERLNQEALNIPLHPNLSREDVDLVIRLISGFNYSL